MASQTTALLFNPIEPFLEAHCYDCHDDGVNKGNFDMAALGTDLSDHATFARRLAA